MREILFKAKVIDTGEWIEGIPIKTHIGLFMCFDENPHYCNQYGYMEIDKIIKVDESTLCQYTGLTDKNGNKIWENDILRYSYDYENSHWLEAKGLTNKDIKYHIGAVFWQEWRGVWAVCGKGTSRGCNQDVYVYSRNPNRVEVIGNIFDNEDLLKGE